MTDKEFRERLTACKVATRLGVDDTWEKLRFDLLKDLGDEHPLKSAVVRLSVPSKVK